jgi:hypothetical protein
MLRFLYVYIRSSK